MNMMDVTEVAKLVRQSLREAFPGFKFSVSCSRYAGGQSIDVRWTDGPRTSDVDKLLRVFEGKRFDGMTDSTSYVHHTFEGEEVWFGADYVHTQRSFSPEFIERAGIQMEELAEKEPVRFQEFINRIHYRGDPARDHEYLRFQFAHTVSEMEPSGSVTVTAILLANPFLHEER